MNRSFTFILFVLLVFSCKQGPKSSEANVVESPDYKELGLTYAEETQKVLGKNLMGTIQKKGVVAAVTFCNERAYPLTDSMATRYHAKIKRVSDKPRNPNNKANTAELAHIKAFKKEVAAGNPMEPIIKEENGKVNFYYPIITNNLCLNCHGTPEQTIAQDVLEQLSELYPEDMATGYDVNEIRGIWSIVFDADAPE